GDRALGAGGRWHPRARGGAVASSPRPGPRDHRGRTEAAARPPRRGRRHRRRPGRPLVVRAPSGPSPPRRRGGAPGPPPTPHGAARPRRPVALTLHNLVIAESSGRATPLLRRLETALLRRVDHVIAPSPAIAARCEGIVDDDHLSVVVPVSPVPDPRRPRDEV